MSKQDRELSWAAGLAEGAAAGSSPRFLSESYFSWRASLLFWSPILREECETGMVVDLFLVFLMFHVSILFI